MPPLSASLFIKEPGKTKTIFLPSKKITRAAKNLKVGESLTLKVETDKLLLIHKRLGKIAETTEPKLAKRISFSLANHAEILPLFVSLQKSGAVFLIKCSLPIFTDEKGPADIRSYARLGEILVEEDKEEPLPEETTDLPEE